MSRPVLTAVPSPSSGSRTRLPRAVRRTQLLDAAGAIITQQGFDALTMEALAEQAGVSKGLGYAYFDNVEDVVQSLWDRELDRLYRRMGDALNEHAPFEEQVRAAVRAYFDLVEERGPLLDVLGAHLTGPASRSERRRRQPFVRELAGLVQHEFDVQPRRARELSALLMSVSATSAWMWRAYGMPRAEVEEVCVAFMLAGVAAASDA
jgi:AcrR family transcriptional regulator